MVAVAGGALAGGVCSSLRIPAGPARRARVAASALLDAARICRGAMEGAAVDPVGGGLRGWRLEIPPPSVTWRARPTPICARWITRATYRAAPVAWRAMIPPAAAAKVAREREVGVCNDTRDRGSVHSLLFPWPTRLSARYKLLELIVRLPVARPRILGRSDGLRN